MVGNDRVLDVTAWALRFAILVATAWLFMQGDIKLGFTGLGVLAIALMPVAVREWTAFEAPPLLDVLIALSAAAHVLGHALDLYHDVPYYDTALHFLVSLGIAFILYLGLLGWFDAVGLHADGNRPGIATVAVATVALTALAGVLWEVWEFAMDAAFNAQNQRNNKDTMIDLIMDTAAGVVMAFAGEWAREARGPVQDARQAMDDNAERAVRRGEAES